MARQSSANQNQTAHEGPKRAKGLVRGVSKAKYLVLSRLVKAGQTTWVELERKGIVLPPNRESDFRKHVRRALKKEF